MKIARAHRFAALPLAILAAIHFSPKLWAQNVDMDVPFVTTPPAVTEAMLDIAGVGPKDFVLDLGSGDGRIVILAAKQRGARGMGVEIDPALVARSRQFARQAGVHERAEFREQDLFVTDLTPATVITMYLLPDVNMALRPKLLALKPGTRVVSHDWGMGDWRPDRERRVAAPEKTLGLDKSSRVMMWTVPARYDGHWCAVSKSGAELILRQTFQQVEGELMQAKKTHVLLGRVEGSILRLSQLAAAELRDGILVFESASGPGGITRWRRATGACG